MTHPAFKTTPEQEAAIKRADAIEQSKGGVPKFAKLPMKKEN